MLDIHAYPPQAPPVAGPVGVPRTQRLVAPHQPHWLCAVQDPQFLKAAQGSAVAVQVFGSQRQAPEQAAPTVDPLDVPVWHRPVPSHHPQLALGVQPAQLVNAAQGSGTGPASGTAPPEG
jgi:hypothetical protein